ncbi:substrate-binding domain-containing protein [Terrimicrobium sacchariphilum]|nr:substrate-binding domain-containing protein [Terrimicrobium sacchariphilum]
MVAQMSYGVILSDSVQTLRRWLESSNLSPGNRLPSERVLARELGLKHNAINRAMSRLLGEGVVRRDGYKLFYAGSEKPLESRFACDLVIARRSFFTKGYMKLAKELCIDLRIHPYDSGGEALSYFYQLDTPETECVIFEPPHLMTVSLWEPAVRKLLSHDIPAISVRQAAPGLPCVDPDYTRAVELAVSHLRDNGHQEMGLLTISPRSESAREILSAWKSLRLQKGLAATARRIAYYSDGREDDIQMIVEKLDSDWRGVSTLVIYAEHDPIVPHLLERLSRKGLRVPQDLAVVCIGDLPHLAVTNPPVTTISFDAPLMQEVIFGLAQRLTRRRQDLRSHSSAPRIRVQPHLIRRASTDAPGPMPVRTASASRRADVLTADLAAAPSGSTEDFTRMLNRRYPLTSNANESRFEQIDIEAFVNRPLNFRKGWLGDLPLTNFATGRHKIHGVPFQVLGGHAREDCGVIVFRSTSNKTGNSRVLPSRLRIPIDTTALAIYILHGCGYSRYLSPFAQYDFYAGRRHLGSVPLVSLGYPPPDGDTRNFEKEAMKANIQDWWSDFPHLDFPHAWRAPVMEGKTEYLDRNVYLYTLEWRNPFPGRTITHMEIAVDAEKPTTLGVLAVSALRPEPEED